jgi:hypothetical protein
VKALS